MLKLLVATLVAVLVILGVVDVVARHYAERELRRRVAASVNVQLSSVHISSFPFLWKLLVSGDIPRISAHLQGVADNRLHFASIDLTVDDVRLNRNDLIDQKVTLTGIRQGTVRAVFTQQELRDALGGLPVTLGEGTVSLSTRGLSVGASLSVSHGRLTLQANGVPGLPSLPNLSVPLPQLPVLPCEPAATVTTGSVQLSCRFTTIPPAFLKAAAGANALQPQATSRLALPVP